MITKTNGCGCQTCNSGLMESPRYFPRQLISATDLNLEQQYFRDRLRRHNRLMHGWGVVCGAEVCVIPKADKSGFEPWKVVVKSGYALGPYGDEILIDVERVVDLRSEGVTGVCGDSSSAPDPWCSQVFVRQKPERLFVAVRYEQVLTRPVRVPPIGCGCDDAACEYSRWCDGYVIGLIDDCPESHQKKPTTAFGNISRGDIIQRADAPTTIVKSEGASSGGAAPAADANEDVARQAIARLDDSTRGFGGIIGRALPDCPPCPDSPWVVLAEVQIDPAGVILSIDNCSCRRIILSLAEVWWQCATDAVAIDKVTFTPASPLNPGTTATVSIEGKNFRTEKPTVTLGPGVTVTVAPVTASKVDASVVIATDAVPGSRTLTLSYGDCTTVVCPNALTIQAAAKQEKPAAPTKKQPVADKSGKE